MSEGDLKTEARMAGEWADIVIERWEKRIARLRIGHTGDLVRSFTSAVEADAKGDVGKITFTYLYYGMFVDMGVGRGTTYAQRGNSRRVAKPWYSSVVRREVWKLGELMIERYGVSVLKSLRMVEQTINMAL